MNRRALYVLIIVAVAVIAFIVYGQMHKAQAPEVSNANGTQSNLNNENANLAPVNANSNVDNSNVQSKAPANTHFSNEADVTGKGAVREVDFDGSNFSPSTLTIKAGDTVVFKNKGNSDFWPASNPHPTHTDYPGFDALGPVAPGQFYQFQFNKVGTWGYHDHLNPSARGTIIVQ